MGFIQRVIALALSLVCTAIGVLWVRGCRSAGVAALATDQMQDRLAGHAFDLSLKNLPLREAIWFLQDTSFGVGADADIDLDSEALWSAGLSPDTPVTVEIGGIPLGLAVARVASAAHVRCRADAELVYISSGVNARPLSAFERPPRNRGPVEIRAEDLLHQPPTVVNSNPQVMGRRAFGRGPVSLTQTTLGHAVDKLGAASGLTFELDLASLRSVGIDRDTPVSITPRNASAGKLLALVLRNASLSEPLQFRPEGGVVRISTRRQFDREDRPRTLQRTGLVTALVIAILTAAYIARRRLGPLARVIRAYPNGAATLLCVGVTGALVACASKPVEIVAFSRRIMVDSGRGQLNVWLSPADPLLPYLERDAATRARALTPRTPVPIKTIKAFRGVEVLHRPWPYEVWFIRTRCAVAAVFAALFPAFWWGWQGYGRLKLRHRQRAGRCLECGYDLRGSIGRCPECGAERRQPAIVANSIKTH